MKSGNECTIFTCIGNIFTLAVTVHSVTSNTFHDEVLLVTERTVTFSDILNKNTFYKDCFGEKLSV